MKKRARRSSGTAGRVAAAVARNKAARFDYVRGTTLVNQAVKKYILNKFEQKMSVRGIQNNQLWHNGGATGNVAITTNLLQTTVGTSQFHRIGDKIYSQGLDFRLWLSNKLDRPNVMYRIIVVSAEASDLPSATNISDLFFAVESGSNFSCMTAFVNVDKYRVHKDMVIQPFGGDYSLEDVATLREHSRFVSFTVNTNKNISYKLDNGIVPVGANSYALFVFAYDAYGTTTVDDIATVAWMAKHRFKDV